MSPRVMSANISLLRSEIVNAIGHILVREEEKDDTEYKEGKKEPRPTPNTAADTAIPTPTPMDAAEEEGAAEEENAATTPAGALLALPGWTP
ncbi:hypothetical protein ACHAWF_015733 [Thalassiosira exigua]